MLKGKGLLSPLQIGFLKAFAQLPDQQEFFLTGGTALGEYLLGHRLSFDLDLFTSIPDLLLPFSRQLEGQITPDGIRVSVVRRFASFVEFIAEKGPESVRVDLALDSPFRFSPPEISEHGVLVNDPTDLVVDKLLAFYGRCEARDAADLHFILKQFSAEELMALAAQKDPGFDAYWFAIALQRAEVFPDDLTRWPVMMLQPFDPTELKQSFRNLADQIMMNIADAGKDLP